MLKYKWWILINVQYWTVCGREEFTLPLFPAVHLLGAIIYILVCLYWRGDDLMLSAQVK